MKALITVALFTTLGFNAVAQTTVKNAKPSPIKKKVVSTKVAPKAPMFRTSLDSASYALGLNVANSFKSGGLKTINYELFNKGLRDVFSKATPALDSQKAQEAINNLFMSFNKQQEEEVKLQYASTIKEGSNFLSQNKIKPGIKTTASGLQYEVITQGTGVKPKATDEVTVNYKGVLLNGFEFDSSYKRGTPATFGLDQVIPAWTEGVQLMPEGSKYRFFVPYQLGYGSRATPDGSIPPYSTLIFEIELIKVAN